MATSKLLFFHGIILNFLINGLLIVIATENIKEGMCNSPACNCDSYGRIACNCGDEINELILTSEGEERLSSFTSRIIIINCPSLIILNSSLTHIEGLRLIELMKIKNLTLFTESFRLSPRAMQTNINIQLSYLKIIPSYTFRGDIEAITFQEVTIEKISSFAFTNLAGTDILKFEDCHVQALETQAFKKFDVNYLYIIRSRIDTQLPSRAISDIGVLTTLRLDGIEIGIIKSSAFIIKKPKTVFIQNCIIENLEAHAFDIATRGSVIIKNNTFGNIAIGSFMGIKRYFNDEIDTLMNYRIDFVNNTLNYFEQGSIMFNRNTFKPFINNLVINDTCQCSHITTWTNNILNYTIYRKFSNSHPTEPFGSIGGEGTYLCFDESLKLLTFYEFQSKMCIIKSSLIFISLGIIFFIILLIIVISMIIWNYKKRRVEQKNWISIPTNTPNDIISNKTRVTTKNINGNITMIVPDGRLYRETEFHVIIEKAEPLITTEL